MKNAVHGTDNDGRRRRDGGGEMKWDYVTFEKLYLNDSRNGLTKPSKVRGSGFKMINMGELFANDRIFDIPMELVPLNEKEKISAKVEKNDLLFARQSLVLEGAGKCSIVMDVSPLTVFESHIIRVRLNKELADPLFYYYYFRSSISPIKTIVQQCAQAGIRGSDLQKLDVIYPPIQTQRRIASILSAYDDLIENNRKQIKLLEEAAQRLYKEWFVDLRFPGHEKVRIVDGVPEGWRKGVIEDVIEFNPKMTLAKERLKQSVPMSALSTNSMTINSNEFTTTYSNSGSKFKNGDTLLARITPCLENGKTGFVSGIDNEGAVGSTEFIVMRSKKLNPYIVYLLARTNDFRKTAIHSMTGSDGRQRAQVDKIMKYPYIIPSQTILYTFEKVIKPIFDKIICLNVQSQKLAQSRDRLLPKLMSGELEV
ncbi:MAG: restriction endonuclease subunit S [Proteobacteria bacterium]|nr:restriction endonuclease subunit S [Pseudomonadota bacterium]